MAPPTHLPDNVRSRQGPFTDQKLSHWVQELRLFFTRRASHNLVSAVVEMAQNLQRHAVDPAEGTIQLSAQGDLWEVCSENLTTEKHADALENKLALCAALSREELRQVYRSQLKEEGSSADEGGGAGLGLITLCRLSELPLEWERIPIAKDRAKVKVRCFVALLDMHVLPPLDLPATEVTPRVHFDAVARTLTFSGESFPEHVADFYQPVQEWVAQYLNSGEPLYVELSLDYLNTSSIKALLDIFDLLEARSLAGGQIAVHWSASSETMQEAGEDLLHGFRFPLRISGSEKSA
jgi:hypothetical protein